MTKRLIAPCEVMPGDEPVVNQKSGYVCHYSMCALNGVIKYGEWTSKGREINSTEPYQTIHTAHSDDVGKVYGLEPLGWYEVPDVEVSLPEQAVTATPTYSALMSEDEAIAHGRRGRWITCVTPPEKTRYRRWIVAL